MKNILTAFCLFISTISFAQQSDTLITYTFGNIPTKKINKATSVYKIIHRDSATWIKITSDKNLIITKKETFSDENLKVLNGDYLEFTNGKPTLKGRYINGMKDGIWIAYDTTASATESAIYVHNKLNGIYTSYQKGAGIKEQGTFLNDHRIGEWTIFTADGKSEVKDYSSGEVDNLSNERSSSIKLISPATFPGGMPGFYRYIGKSIKYPIEAYKNRIAGAVLCSFIVDSSGKLKDIKIISSPNNLLSEEAKRILSSSPKWIPASGDGEMANVRYNVKINFDL